MTVAEYRAQQNILFGITRELKDLDLPGMLEILGYMRGVEGSIDPSLVIAAKEHVREVERLVYAAIQFQRVAAEVRSAWKRATGESFFSRS